MILRGEHGADERDRYLGQLDGAKVLARGITGTGQDLGVQHGGPDVGAVARDTADALTGQLEPDALGRMVRLAGVARVEVDVPAAARPPELSGRSGRHAGLRVTEP